MGQIKQANLQRDRVMMRLARKMANKPAQTQARWQTGGGDSRGIEMVGKTMNYPKAGLGHPATQDPGLRAGNVQLKDEAKRIRAGNGSQTKATLETRGVPGDGSQLKNEAKRVKRGRYDSDPANKARKDTAAYYAVTGAGKDPNVQLDTRVNTRLNLAAAQRAGADLLSRGTKQTRRSVRDYAREGEAWHQGLSKANGAEKKDLRGRNMVEDKSWGSRPPKARAYARQQRAKRK